MCWRSVVPRQRLAPCLIHKPRFYWRLMPFDCWDQQTSLWNEYVVLDTILRWTIQSHCYPQCQIGFCLSVNNSIPLLPSIPNWLLPLRKHNVTRPLQVLWCWFWLPQQSLVNGLTSCCWGHERGSFRLFWGRQKGLRHPHWFFSKSSNLFWGLIAVPIPVCAVR